MPEYQWIFEREHQYERCEVGIFHADDGAQHITVAVWNQNGNTHMGHAWDFSPEDWRQIVEATREVWTLPTTGQRGH